MLEMSLISYAHFNTTHQRLKWSQKGNALLAANSENHLNFSGETTANKPKTTLVLTLFHNHHQSVVQTFFHSNKLVKFPPFLPGLPEKCALFQADELLLQRRELNHLLL